MTFDLETFLTLASLTVAILGLCFSFVKWTNSQVHGRMTQIKADLEAQMNQNKHDLDKRIDDVEHNANRQLTSALDTIKELMREIKEDVRWLMQNTSREKKQ